MKKNIKLLSLDTSTSATGIACYKNGMYFSSTVLVNDKKLKGEEKLNEMIKMVLNYIDVEQPNIVVTEKLSVTRNFTTVSMLAELLGAIRGFCVNNRIDYYTLRPTEWRHSVQNLYSIKPNGRKREDQKAWALDIVNNKMNICTDSDDQAEAILLGMSYVKIFN